MGTGSTFVYFLLEAWHGVQDERTESTVTFNKATADYLVEEEFPLGALLHALLDGARHACKSGTRGTSWTAYACMSHCYPDTSVCQQRQEALTTFPMLPKHIQNMHTSVDHTNVNA